MSFLSGIVNFFKKLWSMIKKILVYVLIAIAVFIVLWAVFATGGAALPLLGFALTTTQAIVASLACLAGAFLIDSDTAKEVTGAMADAVGDATKAAAVVAGSAVSGAISGVLSSSPWLWVALGVGLFFLFKGEDDEQGSSSAGTVTNTPLRARASARVSNNGTGFITSGGTDQLGFMEA